MNSRSLNLYCHYSRGSPLEFCGCLFTSSTDWEIRHLHVVVMQWRKWQRNEQEKHDAWAKLWETKDEEHPVSGEKPSLSILLKVAKKGLCHTTWSSFEAYVPNPNFWADKICFLSHYTSFSRAHIIQIPYTQSLSVSLRIISRCKTCSKHSQQLTWPQLNNNKWNAGWKTTELMIIQTRFNIIQHCLTRICSRSIISIFQPHFIHT